MGRAAYRRCVRRRLEPHREYSRYYEGLCSNTKAVPVTALLMAGETVDFRRIFDAEEWRRARMMHRSTS